MHKIKIFKFISAFFRLLLFFSLSFIWMRYFFNDLTVSILTAAFLTALIDFLLYTVFRRKQTKEALKTKELKEAEDMFLSLLMNKDPLAFFAKLASSKHKCKKFKSHLIVTEGESCVALIPKLQLAPLTADDIICIYKQITNNTEKKQPRKKANQPESLGIDCERLLQATPTSSKSAAEALVNSNTQTRRVGKIVIICGTADKDAYAVASKLNQTILILNKQDTYKKLYKEYEIYPAEITDFKQVKNETLKSLFEYSFNKKRTKAYFFSALVLLFSSFLIGSNVYYIVMSSLLLMFAIISYYNPVFNKKTESKIF